jgi:quinol monooxygenase YgiN
MVGWSVNGQVSRHPPATGSLPDGHLPTEEEPVILATTKVEDFDRFMAVFSTKGAQKRKEHGSKGAEVFRDPNEDNRVWVLFDWDPEGWQEFLADPEVPPIIQEAGHIGRPQAAEFSGHNDA